ncbi:MAG: TonB-dependent receptor [Candidatus Acidiferrales bacterium]
MNFQFARRACVLALLTFALGATSVLAQVPTGSIVGTVVDAQKAAVQGADVTITSQDTGVQYKTQTASNGGYAVQSLAFGLYRVDVNKEGFKVGSVKDLKLDASSQLSVPPIVLEIGARSETVTVEANAAAQVQTTDASVTTHIDQEQLTDLPVDNRQPAGMILMEPGVVDNMKTGDGAVIDGQRTSFTNVTLDGINIQDNFIRINDTEFSPNQLFLSQTGEFAITTQNGDASVGGGSSAISIVTPRGTNAWHGSGFWYYQSNKWSANPWFNNAFGIPNAALNQNQYGGTVGGPIIKNKLFVYGSFEELKDLQSLLQNSTIPTADATKGIFRYAADCVTPPNAGTPCPSGVAPGQIESVNLLTLENSSRGTPAFAIDPAIAALMARIPTTVGNNTLVGDGLNTTGYSFNARDDSTLKNTGLRMDYTPTAHQSFSATYYWNKELFDRPDIDTSYDVIPIVSNNDASNFFSTAWRWSPTANFTNEVRFGYDLAPATFNTTQTFGPSYITGTAFTTPDPNFFFQGRDTHTWGYEDNANLLHGNHSLSFGMQLQRVTIDAVNDGGTSTDLEIGFSPANPDTLLNSDFSAPISATALNNANSLLATLGGFVGTTAQTFNVTSQSSGFVPGATDERNYAQNDWAFYANDAWRFRPNLTITYGLRYEYLSPFTEVNGLMLQPIPAVGESIEQTLLSNATVGFVGGSSGRRSYNKDLHDFGPNIGIAWDPFGDGRTAIRAGYTIHYVNDDLATAVNNALTGDAGLSSTNGNNDAVNTISGVNGLPAAPLVPAPPFQIPTTFAQNDANLGGPGNNAGFAISPNLRTPYVQDWNLSVQRAIGWNTTVTVSYLGNHATDLIRGIDVNQVIINQNGLLSAFNVARNNCFASIAAGSGCNPTFTGPGSEAFPANNIFAGLPGGGFLTAGVVESDIETGQVGTLADLYHVDGIEAFPGQFTPNEYIRGGDLLENFSSSSYNAGVVQVQRRFRNDLIFQGSYTYSKVLDDADGSETDFSPLLDNANPQVERARAAFDVTNAFKANFVYNLPFGQGQRFGSNSGILNRVIGGWAVSSLLTWQSGSPFSFYTGEAGVSGLGTVNRSGRSGNETAILGMSSSQIKSDMHLSFPTSGPFAGDVLMIDPSFIDPSSGLGFLNFGTTCHPIVANGFCNPQPGQLGNLSRNEFNGPMFFDEDLSILKTIPIHESVSLQLRGDAFNVFNHPTFVFGDQDINATTFGEVDSTVPGSSGTGARVLQIGATLRF